MPADAGDLQTKELFMKSSKTMVTSAIGAVLALSAAISILTSPFCCRRNRMKLRLEKFATQ